eukprot:357162-Chlamydomonas_euryale.AAC.10
MPAVKRQTPRNVFAPRLKAMAPSHGTRFLNARCVHSAAAALWAACAPAVHLHLRALLCATSSHKQVRTHTASAPPKRTAVLTSDALRRCQSSNIPINLPKWRSECPWCATAMPRRSSRPAAPRWPARFTYAILIPSTPLPSPILPPPEHMQLARPSAGTRHSTAAGTPRHRRVRCRPCASIEHSQMQWMHAIPRVYPLTSPLLPPPTPSAAEDAGVRHAHVVARRRRHRPAREPPRRRLPRRGETGRLRGQGQLW